MREITRAHDVTLIFDEVKTGAAVAAGGATELYGVTPDVVCLAKAICGGLPGGAIGMTDALAALVADGRVRQQGTFNGNPLVMAAAQAALTEVLTDEAYAQLHAANHTLMAGCERVIAEYGLPAHTVGMGSKGCVVFSTEPVREYRDYLTKIHHDLSDLAWLYHMNNGIFMTPGQDEEWTLSVLHTDADLRALRRGVRDLRARRDVGRVVAGGRHVAHRVLGHRGDREARVHADVGGHRRAVADEQVLVAEHALAGVDHAA